MFTNSKSKYLNWVIQFLADLSSRSLAPTRELREQLDRASLSALLNTAEGNGRRQGRQRAKFSDDARGSAIECAACLDASVAKRFASLDRIQAGKEMLIRIVAMLTKLLMRFDPEQYRVHESTAGLAAPFEHEYPGKAGLFWVRHEHVGGWQCCSAACGAVAKVDSARWVAW